MRHISWTKSVILRWFVAIAFTKFLHLFSFGYAVPTFKPLASSKGHRHRKSLNGWPWAWAWADLNNIFICSMVFWFSFILCAMVASGFLVALNRIWFCLWQSDLKVCTPNTKRTWIKSSLSLRAHINLTAFLFTATSSPGIPFVMRWKSGPLANRISCWKAKA